MESYVFIVQKDTPVISFRDENGVFGIYGIGTGQVCTCT